MRNKFFNIIKLLLSAALLAMLFYKIGPASIITALFATKLQTILLIVLIYVLSLILVAVNYTIFLTVDYPNIKFAKVLRYSLETWALGLFLPSKSGDLLFPFLLKKDGFEVGKTMAAVFVDRTISLLVLCVFALIGALFLMPNKIWLIATAILLVLFLPIASKSHIIHALVKKLIGGRVKHFAGFSSALQKLLARKKRLFLNFLLTNLQWQAAFFMIYILFLERGVHINYILLIGLYALIKLLALVPITLAGLGVKEFFAVVLFGSFAIAAENTMAVFTILLITTYAFAAVVLLISVFSWHNVAHSEQVQTR